MNVTRDIVKDLLTVYMAGDASADTRALVEEWLRSDPELARQAEHAGRIELAASHVAPPTLEKRALDRTRRLLRWRTVLLGTAVYVTTLPLTVTFNRSGFTGLLIEDAPERAVVIGLAAALWIVYWRLSRRLRIA